MQEVQHLPELTMPERRSIARSDALVGLLLVVVILIGGYFRFAGLNWDDFTHLHPDERFLTDVVQGLGEQLNPSGNADAREAQIAMCIQRYPDTAGMGTFFDAMCSTLNPLNANSSHGLYVYGTLPLFIVKSAAEVVVSGSEWIAHNILANDDPSYINYSGTQWATYDGVHLIWRFLSALSEMGIIIICFVIGAKLHDKWIGLLAAYLYAVTVFSIQMAHFGTVDTMSNLFSALAILFAVLVQREGKVLNYALFGFFFGCAVASRINLVPLAAMIAIAGFLQMAPALERRLAPGERNHAILYHFGGLALAAAISVVCFRIFNPYAFSGPGFFGLSLDTRWLDNMGTAQALNAGAIDSPPNFQWVNRLPYLFPLNNMIVWGMGLPFGIVAWISWLWAGYRIIRGKPGAIMNMILFAWVLLYFGWLGRNWVTSMRYFLPIYPALAVLGAWGLVTLIRYAKARVWRRRVVVALLAIVGVFSLLWSGMFTNIYRNLLTRVQATYWVWEHVPGDFAMRVVGSGEAAPIINIGLPNNGIGSRQLYDADNLGSEHQFNSPVSGTIDSLYIDYMDDPEHDVEEENIYFTVTRLSDNVQLADALYTGDLTHADDSELPESYLVRFPEFSVQEGVDYQLNVLMISGEPVMIGSFSIPVQPDAPSETPLINIGLSNNNFGGSRDDLASRVTRLDAGFVDSMTVGFTAPESGTVTSVYAPHLGDPNDDPEPEVLRLTITDGDNTTLATATLNINLVRDDSNILGMSYDIPLDRPLQVEQGKTYGFTIDLVSGGAVISGGSVFTWEGAWDDPVPFTVCALPVGVTVEDKPLPGRYMDARDCPQRLDAWLGLVNGYQQDIVYEDEPSKRDRLLMILDNSDYIVITSNRFYDTLSRNPMRWPMTNLYYDKLFAGELGYDIAATFQETFELGPLRVSDQYLPTYSGPKWLNEFESEEAFSVYDHPVVFIFQKRADYDAQAVHDLLFSVPMTRVNDSPLYANCDGAPSSLCDPTLVSVATLSSAQAAKMPTDLELTDAMREIQYENGTWSERFDATSIVNTSQPVGVLVWWMTIMVFGFAAFPLLFVALPAFADRGYGLAKFAGMFFAGWGTWYLASLRIPVWSQVGIGAALLVLFLIGLALLWRQREEFVDYLREHWKRLAVIELITLVAFLVFLGVRLTNPDLWHPTFGGEKPMDFAYFNGVLRSTIFPPIDPWFTGGYINYYYFGYVIVGTPVLLLKIFPSFAYNLILPTLFSLTGIAAFSVAFTLVNTLHERRITRTEDGLLSRARRLGNPWLAGIAALMLGVVLGNLDTTRVFFSGIAQAGGYSRPSGLSNYLIEQYTITNGAAPNDEARAQLFAEATNPTIVNRIGYEINNSLELVTSLGNGFGRLISGQELSIGAERWFWAPTRVLAETPGVEGSAINEMPIFTFIYGDLHAHMIAMPMQLAVVALVLNEILMAGSNRRKRWQLLLGAALLGMYVGLLRATNTWDWITYMLFSVVGLGFAWWLADSAHFTRRRTIDLAWYGGAFLIASFAAALPYSMWFATSYTSVRPWTDGKTPIWAYFDIHGLFIFLVVSLLVWDTGRWLRAVYVKALRGTFTLLMLGILLALGLVLAAVALSAASYQVTLIVLPLLVWVAVLFFRAGQSHTMQFVLLMAGLALCLTLGVEYVVLEGDIGRQNTVFKFYIQAWLLLSVVGGTAFAWLVEAAGRWNGTLRNVWTFVAVLLIGIAAMFPIMGTRGKAAFRFDIPREMQEQRVMTSIPLTLDGMDFMTYAQQYEGNSELITTIPGLAPFPLNEDYAMIRWLQSSVRGTPTIIEGMSEDPQYKWDSRISIYTGLPTVLGWNWHQRQQRVLDPLGRLVDSRNANVNAFYQTTKIGEAWDIIQYYNVRYVIVGRLEMAYYRSEGLAKFDEMVQAGLLQVAFQAGESTIYRVNPDATIVEQG